MNLKEQILNLVKLQNIDIESNNIKSMLESVSEKYNVLDNRLKEFERNIGEKESMIDELKKEYRSYESEMEMHISKIEKSKEKLQAVKTNKEYQALLKEIDDLNAMNSKKEDDMIVCLEGIEGAENEITGKREEYKELSDDIKDEKEVIEQKSKDGAKKLTELEKDWIIISKKMETQLLEKFIKVKEKVGGVGVVAVNNGVCHGCNMNIPPQMYNELQRFDSMKMCPHCQRIIYWEKRSEQPK